MITLVHGGDIYSARQKQGGEILDFSANINPLGMPEGVCAVLQASLQSCAAYPDPLCRALTAALSEHCGVPAEELLCGNGASDLIYRLVYALRPKNALVLAPCFEEYEQALAAVGCNVRHYFLQESDEFVLTEPILDALTPELDLVFLCSPNNPTGQPISTALLQKILTRCREQGILLALDECFNDFLDDPAPYSMVPFLKDYDNLLILKAFTKLYALAGLRLGYALCSNTALLERMYLCGSPWSVSTPAQLAGVQALRESDYVARTKTLLATERAYLKAGLARLHCRVYGSYANYIFFRSGVPRLREKLEQKGILIRNCANFKGISEEYSRIAVRTRAENFRLLAALEEEL